MLVGFPPFNDRQKAAIEEKIRTETPRFPSSMSEPARNFVIKALQKDAMERPTIMELMQHPWIRGHRKQAQAAQRQQLGLAAEEEPSTPPSADPLVRLQNKMLKNLVQQPQGEMRTQDGDLLRAMPSYLSFTAGSTRPKLPMLLQDHTPPSHDKGRQPVQQISVAPAGAHSHLRPSGAADAGGASHGHVGSSHALAPTPPPKPLKDKRFAGLDLGVGGSAMSFTSSQNPRLQALRGLAKGDHL